MKFKSNTYGSCNVNQIVNLIVNKIEESNTDWVLAIGTDSQNKRNTTKFCEVILLHEVGKGGIFFYRTHFEDKIDVLQNRMLEEARYSIELAKEVIEALDSQYFEREFDFTEHNIKLEIHCDLGVNGKSKVAVKSAIGWIAAEFGGLVTTRIKPDSPAASHIADIHTK